MNNLRKKYGDWALVTGASSGIGKDFALQLAQHGFSLVLIARREDRLRALAAELESCYKIRVVIVPLDLSDRDFISVIEKITSAIEIGLVINNAGFTITQSFTDSKMASQEKLIDVNIRATTVLTHYFGNKMKHAGKGGIINVASASGYLPIPQWSTYAASKAFVLHFTEALWYEMKPFNVDVLALCPGATQTEFNDSANLESGMNVADVVKTGLTNLSKRPSVIAGFKNRFLIAVLKFFSRPALIKAGARVANQG